MHVLLGVGQLLGKRGYPLYMFLTRPHVISLVKVKKMALTAGTHAPTGARRVTQKLRGPAFEMALIVSLLIQHGSHTYTQTLQDL